MIIIQPEGLYKHPPLGIESVVPILRTYTELAASSQSR